MTLKMMQSNNRTSGGRRLVLDINLKLATKVVAFFVASTIKNYKQFNAFVVNYEFSSKEKGVFWE